MPDNNIANLFFLAFRNVQYFQKTIFITNKSRPCTTNCLRIQLRMHIKQYGVIVRPSETFAILSAQIIPYLPLAKIVAQPLQKQLRVALTQLMVCRDMGIIIRQSNKRGEGMTHRLKDQSTRPNPAAIDTARKALSAGERG